MRVTGLAIVRVSMALAVAGCDGGSPQAEPTPAANTAPANPAGTTLANARIQLPAVSGRPGAAYFTVSQSGGSPRTITAVAAAMVGRTEMHETVAQGAKSTMKRLEQVPLAPGATVRFTPGSRHVMLFDLDPKLRFQDEVELSVTFADGDTATTRAKVTTLNTLAVDGDMEAMR